MKYSSNFNLIASLDESTVICEFYKQRPKSNLYQSEEQLEFNFINQLINQGYEHLKFNDYNNKNYEEILLNNLRKQLELLNKYQFSNNEWNKLFHNYICNKNEEIYKKTEKIQKDFIYSLELDNGSWKNIHIIDKKNIHNNKLQIINQYVNESGSYKNIYDVTILINGFLLIHIELKRRGVNLKEAFNQINRYKNNSFSSSYGLFDYIQIFVISNGTITKYYSNSTRNLNIKNDFKIKSKTNNSFEFTNYWSDSKNNIIDDLDDFAQTFFAKHTLLNIITKYCIFTCENELLVMRPYQIAATESIINKIKISNNYKNMLGTIEAGGYIWHTTGSGKTVTSFKAAQLVQEFDFVDKVIFVVDRKDLDYQTMKEYDRFEKDSANSNSSTKILQNQLENKDSKIIITTIQKLSIFIKNNKKHDIYQKHVVLIFDECHRSQFGDMHLSIERNFKKYNIFGFTGTPIFAENANTSIKSPKQIISKRNVLKKNIKTTEQLFGERLHTYTIVNAINDKNVLPFRFTDNKTFNSKKDIKDEMIKDIDVEKVWLAPKRIEIVTKYIIDNFNKATHRNESYFYNKLVNISEIAKDKKNLILQNRKKIDIKGFNSIFAVSNIEAAKLYYNEFKKQLSSRKDVSINFALIYSFSQNENLNDVDDFIDDECNENTNNLDLSSREFLDKAIDDYNKMFGTSYDSSSEKFQNYYRDVSLRMKNKEIDLLIVVNMFLIGFDAITLNTLWVDKWLRMHGLIQAFSRTNRILNSVKQYGNIVSFRPLSEELEKAIKLFGDRNSSGIIILRPFKDYYNGYKNDSGIFELGYKQLINNLLNNFPLEKRIVGDENKKEFINLFSHILQIINILLSFEEFVDDSIKIITQREMQDYLSKYQDVYDELKKCINIDKENIIDDLVFEVDLVKQLDINIDYIFNLISNYFSKNKNDRELLTTISKIISSSYELRSKKELIEMFVMSLYEGNKRIENIDDLILEFNKFKQNEKCKDLNKLIVELNLDKNKTFKFINNCFEHGKLKIYGIDIDEILPPVSRFSKDEKNNRKKIKEKVIWRLQEYFDKYFNI